MGKGLKTQTESSLLDGIHPSLKESDITSQKEIFTVISGYITHRRRHTRITVHIGLTSYVHAPVSMPMTAMFSYILLQYYLVIPVDPPLKIYQTRSCSAIFYWHARRS